MLAEYQCLLTDRQSLGYTCEVSNWPPVSIFVCPLNETGEKTFCEMTPISCISQNAMGIPWGYLYPASSLCTNSVNVFLVWISASRRLDKLTPFPIYPTLNAFYEISSSPSFCLQMVHDLFMQCFCVRQGWTNGLSARRGNWCSNLLNWLCLDTAGAATLQN